MTNESRIARRRSLRAVIAIVIALGVIVTVFTSTAFADSSAKYDVKIIDGSEESVITTTETEPIEILKDAGITVDAGDKLNLTEFVSGEGGQITVSRKNTISVDYDDEIQTYSVYSNTVGEALSEIGAVTGKNDKINYTAEDSVKDGMVIQIKTAFSVSVKADGKKQSFALAEGTVKDVLSMANIKLGKNDYTEPSLNTELSAGMKIKVYRVKYKKATKTAAVPFETKKINDSSLYKGTEVVATEGKNGSKTITYSVRYVNGKEESRQKIHSEVTLQPVTKVVKVGTKIKPPGADATPNGVKTLNGYKVGQVIDGRYTHYCACARCNGNGRGITSSGRKITNGMQNPYYIACNWLPLGSVINVDGTNYTVVDRGGSGLSRRGRIDIFTPEGHAACYRYGTGSCTIRIERLGW